MSNIPNGLRRASMGTYEAVIGGARVVFRRNGTRGFILELGKAGLHHKTRRLRNLVDIARRAVAPVIFDVMEEDEAFTRGGTAMARHPDPWMPVFLRRYDFAARCAL